MWISVFNKIKSADNYTYHSLSKINELCQVSVRISSTSATLFGIKKVWANIFHGDLNIVLTIKINVIVYMSNLGSSVILSVY